MIYIGGIHSVMDLLGLYFYEYVFVVFQESVAELKKVAVVEAAVSYLMSCS